MASSDFKGYVDNDNLYSSASWWAILNLGILAYYSHDFSFLTELRFLFAEILLFIIIIIGGKDVKFLKLQRTQQIRYLIAVLAFATVLHFQFEHSFKYFFFGEEQ